MASSTHHHLSNPYGGSTAAPPPTPSTQPNPLASPDADVLSLLLHRLPPALSLPTRRSPPSTPTTSPPLVSLSPQNPNSLADLLSAASQLGFFQLTTHSVPSQLAQSAESESLSLFNLSKEQKQLHFPPNWPLGFDCDDEEDENGTNASFCIDSSCSTESTELSLSSLCELTREMEKLGLDVIEALSCAVGFENPVREDPTRVCSLMWVSEGCTGKEPVMSGKFYPYVVGLHYQIRRQRCSLLSDSGWVSVSPRVDSVLVTLGDLAQVWSNGKTKKVRGRPVPSFDDSTKNARCIWMSLLVTLPLESTVSPLIPMVVATNGEDDQAKKEDGGSSEDTMESRVFNSFSFEDYAWRVYHERLLYKDPLDRYRI
ncbi:Gibberellin 2-beta-dioxygenase [Actinidia chinensis var. chinensis]|uniref:Gibberellin 2-beta-dioxygenase n=1 Tax=Actinidia chinensis var. chinensis TaxID=1590841 RepID=A0A2R6RWR1_ACTCC|nr:Gibberellin 2-beta-dioxygenase [Actinidia chinensis var. chinensis]